MKCLTKPKKKVTKKGEHEEITLGKAEILKEGKDLSIITIGKTVTRGMKISNMLKENKIDSEVINARFLKPLDKEKILKSISKTKFVITIEDGTIINGLGTAVKELITDENLDDIIIKAYAYPDEFIKHGEVSKLEEIYHQDAKSIYDDIIRMKKDKDIKENKKNERRNNE